MHIIRGISMARIGVLDRECLKSLVLENHKGTSSSYISIYTHSRKRVRGSSAPFCHNLPRAV